MCSVFLHIPGLKSVSLGFTAKLNLVPEIRVPDFYICFFCFGSSYRLSRETRHGEIAYIDYFRNLFLILVQKLIYKIYLLLLSVTRIYGVNILLNMAIPGSTVFVT